MSAITTCDTDKHRGTVSPFPCDAQVSQDKSITIHKNVGVNIICIYNHSFTTSVNIYSINITA